VNDNQEIISKIKDYIKPYDNKVFSDAELEEIHQSLIHFGKAVARYERVKYERNGN
jgi:hypothetical protein